MPLKDAGTIQKPDISCFFPGSQGLDWRNVATFCKVKNRGGPANERSSYIEAAGKASCLLYAQDGHHSAPCIHILSSSMYLTIFDRGRSLSTAGFDIHTKPDVFLHILVGVSMGTLRACSQTKSVQKPRGKTMRKTTVLHDISCHFQAELRVCCY